MYPYVETIRILNGRVRNIVFHNQRCNTTRKVKFGLYSPLDLRKHITSPSENGTFKCRILYRENIEKVEYFPYDLKPIRSLKMVFSDSVEYNYKSTNRKELDNLYRNKNSCDDILIIKNQLITDTYYGNVALLKKNQWYTPAKPLLPGTMRYYLLKKGKIEPCLIKYNQIKEYEKLCVFNAMIPFGKIIIQTINIC